MRHGGRFALGLALGILTVTAAEAAPSLAGKARLEPVAFADLAGWDGDDHAAAFAAFLRTCKALAEEKAPLRPAREPEAPLVAVCRRALAAGPLSGAEARRFFETHFRPAAVVPLSGEGFLTGYYEPEFSGSRVPDGTYRVPLLARPDDLVTVAQGETLPGLDPGFQAARRTGRGYEPYPDRAAIEDGALGDRARPVVFLREPGEAFIIHVQGSARIRLPDGSVLRVAYAGRNGHPYTSIGRLLVQRGEMDLETMTLEKLLGWLRENPEKARSLMRENRSYIFFREADELSPEDGPVGGAGVPLTPGRSLAVDRSLWSYGLPVWLDGRMPVALDRTEPLQRLMIAQDTGSAIVGPARGDFFVGSGEEAGTRAGLLRHPVRFVVFQPVPSP
ncbi:murein transglycosylase A [Microvirga thermotolerans]|uniref:peptidoglycan lytic exotransglycosylase n=1 Tax=Microvirga thermotolerans TaxID=2651334 RepID=A0A5P9JT56_9HYPH|nr:MltA domain-containing protein [Microvirga thermotolerans]QFU14958.1 lytic murein transglycosylase [Microvirga thermotolerans]